MRALAFWRVRQIAATSWRRLSTAVKNEGPLAGIRILDMTRILAGPYCTMILGDLGAEIIKVERLDTGDETRQWGPPFVGTESCYFLSVNRNKKSIAVDLKHKMGQNIIHQLAQQCDVLIENFIPGNMEKMGLGYEQIKSTCSKIVYCSISGYGSTGPYSHKGGFDVLAAAMGGLLGVTGPQSGEPCKVGVAMTDLATGLYAHGAILAALIERQKSGLGQKIECNLLSTQVACMVNLASNYLNAGQVAQRWGTAHESIVPYQAFQTSNGHIVVGVGSEKHFKFLCQVLQCEHLLLDNRFTSNEKRVKNRDTLVNILLERFKTNSTTHWLELLGKQGIPCSSINNMAQVFEDPQVLHNGLKISVDHPSIGSISLVGPAVKYSESVNHYRLPPPSLGQHTKEVLRVYLNYSESDIKILQKDGVIH